MILARWRSELIALALAFSPAAFASDTDLASIEEAIAIASEEVGSGYTNIRVLDAQTVGEQTCYRIAFTDQGTDVELLLNADNFQPCSIDVATEMSSYLPPYIPAIYLPAVWTGIHSTLINAPSSPRDDRSPRRPRRERPCRRRC